MLDEFNPFATPAALHARFAAARPDVVVVSPGWLVTTALLFTLLDVSGNRNARRAIGVRAVSDVVKIQSAYRGYFDVVDLSRQSVDAAQQITNIHHGVSSLDHDVLWSRVPRPFSVWEEWMESRNQTDNDILKLLSLGLRDIDIAAALFLSVQTIKNRVSSMLDRSGVNNRTQLALRFTNQQMLGAMTHHARNEQSCPIAEAKAS